MKLFAGWYCLYQRQGRVLALIAGPVQDRVKAESFLAGAQALATARYGLEEGDRPLVGWLALPEPLPGVFNDVLWVKGEFQEYDA